MGKKTPKTTPRTTVINPATVATVLTRFSPETAPAGSSLYYAHLHCAPDAHTLRVYEVESGKCVSRWASNAAGADGDDEPRVRSLEWCWLPAPDAEGGGGVHDGGKRGKKRRKSDGGSAAVDSPAKPQAPAHPSAAIALGLENGAVLLWDPRGVAPPRTLHHATSTSPVTALASPVSPSYARDGHLWTAHEDGSVRLWDLGSAQLVGKVSAVAQDKRWDDLVVRYDGEIGPERTAHVVLSHLSLHVYSVQLGVPKPDKVKDLKATELGRCTGHVEPAQVRWTGAASARTASTLDTLSFLSYTPSDRFVQVWSVPAAAPSSSSAVANGALVARLALDSGVSSASISPLSPSAEAQTLAAIDTVTGAVSLATLPLVVVPQAAASPKKGKKNAASAVVALHATTEITSAGSKGEAGVSQVAFRESEDGKAIVCRGGVKPVFEVVAFKDEEGLVVKKVELSRSANGSLLVGSASEISSSVPQPTRYTEHTSSSVAATSAAPDAAGGDDSDAEVEAVGNAGELDVDLAEPTLADRLKALNVSQKKERRKAALAAKKAGGASESSGSEDDDEDEDDSDDEDDDDEEEEEPSRVPATTLTTTLVQALHSSDAPLLESCLAHSNPALVRATVKRLPSGSLVLSLLEALVDRLGKEKRGKDGMASVKRAKALVGWLRETLIVHVGFLVTIPSLVNRLASLHASLTQRLALQPSLLALNGRLELVMSQIDLRQDRRPAAASSAHLSSSGAAASSGSGRSSVTKAKRYVEGESDDDDEGAVEDVVLGPAGGDFDDDFSDEAENDDDDDLDSAFEDEEDGAGSSKPRRKVNGVSSLLDLEASEDDDFDDDDDEVDEEEFEGIDDDDEDLEDGDDE
ncbi:hypothetical protein JCM11491_006150 [Sporobolomyces phaffii]